MEELGAKLDVKLELISTLCSVNDKKLIKKYEINFFTIKFLFKINLKIKINNNLWRLK